MRTAWIDLLKDLIPKGIFPVHQKSEQHASTNGIKGTLPFQRKNQTMLLQAQKVKSLASILLFSNLCIPISQGDNKEATHTAVKRNVFVELPGMEVPGDHWILTHAKISLREELQSFDPIPETNDSKDNLRREQSFGIVFLTKKNERGLPSESAKREMLFSTLDSKSSSDGITHWYIFQMRSSSEDLIGVYGPAAQIK